MKSRPITSLLTLLLAGCGGAQAGNLARARTDTLPGGVLRVSSDGPTAWPEPGGTLVEEHRFQGEDGTPGELGEPRSLAVDEWGRVYVVDSKPATIKVFTPDGKLIRTIGREGEGPGEFRVGFIATRGEHLVLHDPRIGRTSVFDTAGTFIRSWLTSCCYWSDIQIDREQRVYVPSMVVLKNPEEQPRGTPYVRWSLEGTALDTLWVPYRKNEKFWSVSFKKGGKNVMSMMTSVPFTPQIVSTLHPDGGIVSGWSGEYSLVRSLNGSDSARVFGRSWTPDPVTPERRQGEVESRIKGMAESYGEATLRNAFKTDDIPATFPAFEGIRVDRSGRIWVRRFAVSDTTRTFFDVFDSTGAWLGKATVPLPVGTWGPQAWTTDGLVAIVEDDDGRPTVVRFKLEVSGRP